MATENILPTTLGQSSSNELSKEDIVDLLSGDETVIEEKEEEKEEKPKKEKDEDDDNEEKEEDEIKIEDEEVKDDDLELMVPARRQEILKAYPDLFKKFPYLERAYYRDQKFTEMFATPQEAEEVIERAKSFEEFETTLLEGNIENILNTIRTKNPNSFGKLVDNYLPALSKIDSNAFNAVLGNVVKNTVSAMVEEAGRINNEDLKSAALILNQFVFGSSKFTPPTKFHKEEPEVSDAEKRIKEREHALVERKFKDTSSEINTKIDNTLKSTIDRHIDPKGALTAYEKKHAINEALQTAQQMIDEDKSFSRILDNLWKEAFKNDFNQSSKDKIRSAYLSKAKTVLPEAIKKIRAEALKDKKRTTSENKRGPLPPNRTSTSSTTSRGKTSEDKPQIQKGMSTYDFLSED